MHKYYVCNYVTDYYAATELKKQNQNQFHKYMLQNFILCISQYYSTAFTN